LEPFWQPWPGVSPIRHFEGGEGPGDEVAQSLDGQHAQLPKFEI